MKIYLARHGLTNYNELGLSNDDPTVDVHLSETGIKQANELAEKLKEAKIDHIFVSELKRTRQTADSINKFHNALIQVDPRLNDNRTGYEGKPSSDYDAALEKADNKWTIRLNGGESLEDVKDRVQSFIDDLRTKDYESVLIVTSRVVVQMFYAILNGLTNEQAYAIHIEKGSCRELELH